MTTAEQKRKEGGFAETVRVVIHALIIAVVIRTFLFQPFNIPSGSMMATLLIGDYLFVSKYTYGYSRFSFPFSPPLFSGRDPILGKGPQRGDVVVFRLPRDDFTDYIKRVIGLPGDRIQMIDGVLQHQRHSRSSASAPRTSSAPRTAPASSGSSAGRRRCRTASSITRSIWSTTHSTTTRRSTPCRPATTS